MAYFLFQLRSKNSWKVTVSAVQHQVPNQIG